MRRPSVSRAAVVLLASLLVGGLLLMHGIEPPGAASSHDATVAATHSPGGHESHADHDHDGDCTTCGLLGHGALLCVAVVGSVLGIRLLQRCIAALRRRAGLALDHATASWSDVVQRVHRLPRPVWVELGVMRC